MLSRVNKLLTVFYMISCGRDLGRFFLVRSHDHHALRSDLYMNQLLPDIMLQCFLNHFQVLASLWLLSIFGSYSSALNVLYVGKSKLLELTCVGFSYFKMALTLIFLCFPWIYSFPLFDDDTGSVWTVREGGELYRHTRERRHEEIVQEVGH